MGKVMVIVARDRTDLYEYFRRGFESVDRIRVILDRRVHMGGGHGEKVGVDPERRREIEVYEELQVRGFILRRDS